MQGYKVTRELHMKCDICGKEETLKEQPFRELDCLNYGWSELEHTRSMSIFGPRTRTYHLCPICTGKFGVLVKEIEAVVINESEETIMYEPKLNK